VVTDGSAVLGLGNIGPEAAMPVMEGKSILFKALADIDAFPICLGTQDNDAIIQTVRYLAPSFGGINLEDIAAPRCFEIEDALQDLGIPVFHDDQHGTAIAVLAGVINALLVTGRRIEDTKFVFAGAGAGGIGSTKLLLDHGATNVTLVDSTGIISRNRFRPDGGEISHAGYYQPGQHPRRLGRCSARGRRIYRPFRSRRC